MLARNVRKRLQDAKIGAQMILRRGRTNAGGDRSVASARNASKCLLDVKIGVQMILRHGRQSARGKKISVARARNVI